MHIVPAVFRNAKTLLSTGSVLTEVVAVSAAIGRSINMWHIKHHYFTSHPKLNYYAIVPVGGGPWWEQSNNRDEKFPTKQ